MAERTTDGHASRFWAGALATHATSTPATEYDYTPAPSKQDRDNSELDNDDYQGKRGW
jgi:phage FluMu gp28-like protein